MLKKVKDWWVSLRMKKIYEEVEEHQREEKERYYAMWDERRWEACLRLYVQYPDMKYETAVHQATKLVDAYRNAEGEEE